MNRQSKSAIKSLVLALRHKLEDEIAIRLKFYGFAGERWRSLEGLRHIQRDDRATSDRFRLKAALEQHLRRIGADPNEATPEQRAEAVEWFVREVAFTHLNRLVALKCLEVRRLIAEIITIRDAYGGRSRAHYDYRNAHPDEARQADDALLSAIRHACRQVYAEFKFLFDVGDPATDRPTPANSILWPSHLVLKECIGLINGLDEVADNVDGTLWAEDEIIGWIYQFYNTEEKQAIRKRGRPRRPAEVAVINQFFTPRWIVKFLVDNTLGRLWLEMHPDSERVRGKCDYLVPEPLPSPTPDAEGRREGEGFPLDPDSPINDPTAPPRREAKRPQDIRLIDPACGTMHFGHYAFEVFQEIYCDARERGWVTGDDALTDGELPAAILRHNLYGVDIDLRAVQLAGLSLFIKARLALSQVEAATSSKAHISQVNLVVADAVLPADGARQRFLDHYKDDKVVQDAVRQVLDEMANVAEVGSLLRVEERLRQILAKAGHEAVRGWERERQGELPGLEPPRRQLSLADVEGVAPEQWGAHYTLARLLDDLRAFAAKALQTHDLNAQLFTQEAEKSVHLLDVFLNSYDVVVMNPPYGSATKSCKRYIQDQYPQTTWDIYTSFVARAYELAEPTGFVGALTNRTFLYSPRIEGLRDLISQRGGIVALAELGLGVLDDATVRVAASVLRVGGNRNRQGIFFGLRNVEADRKNRALYGSVQRLWRGYLSERTYLLGIRDFDKLPGRRFAYWLPAHLAGVFRSMPTLQPVFAEVRQGAQTGKDDKYLRFWWEVPREALGDRWRCYLKGGGFLRYYADVERVIDWSPSAVGELAEQGNKLPNRTFYFRSGVRFPNVGDHFCARYMPEGCIISATEHGVYPIDSEDSWYLLGILNSTAAELILGAFSVDRHHETGHLQAMPIPQISEPMRARLADTTGRAHDLKAAWDTGNETCTRFEVPWLVQAHRETLLAEAPDLQPTHQRTQQLAGLLNHVRAVEQAADGRVQQLQAQVDESGDDLYGVLPRDRLLAERELGVRPPELVWPQMERRSDEEKRREHVRRLISFFLLRALKEKRDGILPLTLGTGQATALDEVRRRMEGEFGEELAFGMETEIKETLGQSVGKWLDGPFSKWHTNLYKRRPIIWHLASPRSSFACFVHYHKLDRDMLSKVQTQYLWPRRRSAGVELEAAQADKAAGSPGAARRIDQAEAVLDDLADFEKRLVAVIQAQVECEVPDWAEGPFRGGVYDPVLDDGVKVNIMPLQAAGVLRHRKVV